MGHLLPAEFGRAEAAGVFGSDTPLEAVAVHAQLRAARRGAERRRDTRDVERSVVAEGCGGRVLLAVERDAQRCLRVRVRVRVRGRVRGRGRVRVRVRGRARSHRLRLEQLVRADDEVVHPLRVGQRAARAWLG